uniref:Uncharacterized protein n=1 Tax=Megaselia scalaris TaxID=36166 RepID=T1GWL4_MEGSC
MDNSTERALNDANRALVNIIGELKHIGWLSKRLGGSTSGSVGGGTGSGPGSASSSGGGGIVGITSSAGNGCDQSGRSSSESSEENDKWQSIFVAITEREFR